MPSKRQIQLSELPALGVTLGAEEMTNQENRVRLAFDDGNRVVVVMSDVGGWQDSAVMVREDYRPVEGEEFVIVQQGWAAIATFAEDDRPVIRIYGMGSKFNIDPNKPHNTYVSKGGRVVAVISGSWEGVKRQAVPKLDALTQNLRVDQIYSTAVS